MLVPHGLALLMAALSAAPAGAVAAVDAPPGNAFEVWTQPLEQDPGYLASRLPREVLLGDVPENLREALLEARQHRPRLEQALALMRRGLDEERCEVTDESPLAVETRAQAALGIAVIDAYDGKPSPAVVETVLRVGSRLARCAGPTLALSSGLQLFETAQGIAIWLTEHGVIDAVEAARLAALMEQEQPTTAMVKQVLIDGGEVVVHTHFARYRNLDPLLFAPEQSERLFRKELMHLVALADKQPRSWVDAWGKRLVSVVTPRDRQHFGRINGAIASDDLAAAARGLQSLDPKKLPRNIFGRLLVAMLLPSAQPVADARVSIANIALRTKVFLLGIVLVEAARKGQEVTPATRDRFRISRTEASAESLDGLEISFKLKLGEALTVPEAGPAERDGAE